MSTKPPSDYYYPPPYDYYYPPPSDYYYPATTKESRGSAGPPSTPGGIVISEATNPKDLLGIKKAPLHLVPSALGIWVSQIFKMSAIKYGPFNWREKKVKRSIYLDAIERHLIALKDGQDRDTESGQPHEAHIAANCAILLEARAIGNLVDDMTWKSGPGPDLLKQVEDKVEEKA